VLENNSCGLTRIAAMESVSLCVRMESWLRLWNRKGHRAVKSWEISADNLSKAGWSLGCVSALDREVRTIWIVSVYCLS